jgi:hypothetical protein
MAFAATASKRGAFADMKKAAIDVAQALARLSELTIFELRGEWRRLHRMPPPMRATHATDKRASRASGRDWGHRGAGAQKRPPHEPRARLQRDRLRGFGRAAAQRVGASSLQLPCGGRGEAAIRPLLKLVTDPSGQEIAGEPHRRRHAMKPPPLPAQLEDGQLREPHERLC